ncbi:MAG: MFS transporter [Acidimicrobiales bacterium]|nr:MFS transporter [Acidimicrobiales bacterium]
MTVALDPDPSRTVVQRRSLQVLFASSSGGRAATSVMFFVAVLAVKEILGNGRWAGLTTVALTLGTAVGSSTLSSLMDRRGRRPGLTLGYALAAIGAVVAAAGVEYQLLTPLLLGMGMAGLGQGSTNLSRYAAADLAAEDQRSRAISMIVFASTLGAVSGPLFAGGAGNLSERLGLLNLSGPFLAGAVFFTIAGVIVAVFLRPDPLVVAGGLGSTTGDRRLGFVESMGIVVASPGARLGLITLCGSSAVMVMVMAMTPLHMDANHHGTGTIGWIISAHTAGMFAFAPLAGWFSDRRGRIPAILLGAAILILSTAITAVATEAPNSLMFPGLYLLGLGWSFGMVAGSALVTESVTKAQRVSAQGAVDVAGAVASGAGALSSGVIFTSLGFGALSILAMLISGTLLVVTLFHVGKQRSQRVVVVP